MKSIFLYTLIFGIFSCSSSNYEPCVESRGALDLGSGSTTYYVARFDKCTNTILQREFKDSQKIAFKEALTNSGKNIWTPEFQNEALGELKKLLNKYPRKISLINAYATAAFRQSSNAEDFVKKVEASTGIHIRVIPQNEEAFLGLRSAEAQVGYTLTDTVVWDIGGASMQMVIRPDFVFEGGLASYSFKEMVLEQILKKPKTSGTPNPLNEKQIQLAVELARSHALKNITPQFRKQLLRSQGRVMGIGGVHNYSIGDYIKKIGKKSYTQNDLTALLKSHAGKTDEQLRSVYASTDVTNVALILGYMQALDIEEVVLTPTDPVLQ